MDQSKKTMRHFYCRDVLWETFEQMANDFDCSIDYLVNEAMRYYARSKNYQQPGGGGGPTGGNVGPGADGPRGPGPGMNGNGAPVSYPGPTSSAKPQSNGPGGRGQPGTQPPPQPSNGPGASMQRRPVPQPTPGYTNSPAPTQARSGGGGGGGGGMHNQQVQPQPPPPAPPVAGAGPTLFLVYNGQRYPVTKDQFIIGRGSKTSDLAIKDGNISRKHAAVIRRNGTFYIKDLGSTNGIDYKGMRIDNKRIDEGDVFHLCDYELRFTYRTD